jgi:predicted nuclease with RNAse H fold
MGSTSSSSATSEALVKTTAVGIDWASQVANRAAVSLVHEAGRIVVKEVLAPADEERTAQLFDDATVDVVGVDTPFGWPAAFVAFVREWSVEGARGAPPPSESFRYRRTDVLMRKGGKNPLSVSSDLISLATRAWLEFAAARGLTRRFCAHVPTSARRPIIEVYPAATLLAVRAEVGLSDDAVKQFKRNAKRRRLSLSKLFTHFNVEGDLKTLNASDHVADAFLAALSALIALDAVPGWTTNAPPDDPTVRSEGWIYVPKRA